MHQMHFGTQADFIIYSTSEWPSFSYWMIPGSQLED